MMMMMMMIWKRLKYKGYRMKRSAKKRKSEVDANNWSFA
jgi:hypothetical protein